MGAPASRCKASRCPQGSGRVRSGDDSSIAAYKAEVFGEMAKAADANESPHPELPLRSDLPSSSGIEKAARLSWNTFKGPMCGTLSRQGGIYEHRRH